eukprot:CAMPEP_0203920192 /NCGR_PEP_ID=MMETSP0359-20131031/60522_1 /ASSEMBLY_ACC=CAM_ASM_000338 /TAXON_ID=268821 /ORGANISM="Scrippsiella Hangoei, Strain SHTV-5" /LENGTH=176 /DNA_ID=CAMNT_0050847643 /DNA_START=30 /DNA_END=557 /DNA_ORIENTATION=+
MSAASAWLALAEDLAPEEEELQSLEDLRNSLVALRQLSSFGGDGLGLWRGGLSAVSLPRLRAAELRLRSRVTEGLTRVRHGGGGAGDLGVDWPTDDEIRPPWSADVPSRVAAALEASARTACALEGESGETEEVDAFAGSIAILAGAMRSYVGIVGILLSVASALRRWPKCCGWPG